jgi:hypothetical protein
VFGETDMKKTSLMLAILSAGPLLLGWLPQARSDPGDMIITRTVSPRSAFRSGSGPVGSKANPGQQVQSALGLNQNPGGTVARELNNTDFANVVTGMPMRGGNLATPGAGMAGALASNRLDGTSGGTVGRVMTGTLGGGGGGAIGSIGGTVQQATGQLMDALKGAGLIGR